MAFTPLLAGTSAAGLSFFRCPKCRALSARHQFRIDRDTKRIECGNPNCRHAGAEDTFIPAVQDAAHGKLKKSAKRPATSNP